MFPWLLSPPPSSCRDISAIIIPASGRWLLLSNQGTDFDHQSLTSINRVEMPQHTSLPDNGNDNSPRNISLAKNWSS